jgi:filamin
VPSGQEKEVFTQEMDRDLYAMRIIPTENGIHYVHVHLNEANIPGSPFAIVVGKTTADPALVLASGDGLSKGEVGRWRTCVLFKI